MHTQAAESGPDSRSDFAVLSALYALIDNLRTNVCGSLIPLGAGKPRCVLRIFE
jgi:hypothetical protein